MYKVILFNHGQTAANGSVLLDTSSGENPGLTQAVVETKLNEAGSFNYSIVPTHPLYNMTGPLKVYVSVEEDDTEIFYGRILSVQTNPLTKIKSVTCEGALAFLLDCELQKDEEDWETTAANYFRYCINKYNEGIQNDANRLLKIGTINVSGSSETHTYNNGSFSQIQSVMKSQLLNAHDGFFRIRRNNSTGEHYIDWVEQVGESNPQQIAITHNVVSQTNTESGEDIFSIMRPVGNDDLTLSGDGLIKVSQSMVDDYGPIIRTVTFDASDASTLRSKAQAYIQKIKNRLTITGDISFVDFHFLDGSSTIVHAGDVFTNIEGYEGTKLTAESVSRNLLDAGKDKLSIKSDKELMNSATASGANSANTTGVKAGRKASSGAAHMHKFYHETQTDASIAAKNLYLSAEEKIETRAQSVETYADEIDEKLSEAIGKVKVNTDNLQTEWTTYKGTEIYKNKDHIDQVCGLYQVQEYTDPQTGKTVKNLVVQEGSALYQTHDGVVMGVYDSYNLTGGMMVQEINKQTQTLIKGALVNIGDTGSTVKLSDKITVVDGGTLIKGLVMFKANASATNTVSINNGKVTAETVQPTTLAFHGTGGEDDYVNLGYATVANMLTNAEVDTANNTLKIWKIGDAANAPSITFRKATSLSGVWSGDLPAKMLTVKTDDPQGPSYLVKFEGTYSANRTNLEVHSAGSLAIEIDSVGAKQLTIPVKVQRLTGGQSEPETVYETTLYPFHMGLLTSKAITSNGSYNLANDSEHIGWSSVTVNVPDKAVGTRFGAGNGNYWVEGFYSGVSGGPTISGSETGYKLELTGTKSSAVVQIKYPTTEGTKIPDTAELTVGDLYTQGQNDVTIDKGTWSGGKISFTKSAGTASTKSVQLVAGDPIWNGNVASVKIWDGTSADSQHGVSTGYRVKINASDKIASAVSIAIAGVSVSCDAGTMEDGEWVDGGWSADHKQTVRLYKDSTQVDSFEVDAGDMWNGGGKTSWLYKQSGSTWAKVTKNTTLGQGTYHVRYTNKAGTVTDVPNASFSVAASGITGLTKVTSNLKEGVTQVSGYNGLKKYEAFYKERNDYISMGTYYWFRANSSGYSNDGYTYYWKPSS